MLPISNQCVQLIVEVEEITCWIVEFIQADSYSLSSFNGFRNFPSRKIYIFKLEFDLSQEDDALR